MKITKTKQGKTVKNVSLVIFPPKNAFISKLKNDIDLTVDFKERDEEIDLELTGKIVPGTTNILLISEDELCYNFTEYVIKKDKTGQIIPCEQCGGVYCEHRIKKQVFSNINDEDIPIVWIKKYFVDKKEALKTWSFDRSYQLIHTSGLTFDFLYKMAKILHDLNKLVFVAPVVNKIPQKLVIRTGMTPFYGFLEGRIEQSKYSLVIHGTTFKLSD